MTTVIATRVAPIASMLRRSGPYLLLELLMPGGTLLALLLFYYRRRKSFGAAGLGGGQFSEWLAQVVRQWMLALAAGIMVSAWPRREIDDGLMPLAMAPIKVM